MANDDQSGKARTGIAFARILKLLREIVECQGTNPYQIAKATGVSLFGVQSLIAGRTHPTLRSLETIIAGLGYEVRLVKKGDPIVKPGTGRGHGPSSGKRRKA